MCARHNKKSAKDTSPDHHKGGDMQITPDTPIAIRDLEAEICSLIRAKALAEKVGAPTDKIDDIETAIVVRIEMLDNLPSGEGN